MTYQEAKSFLEEHLSQIGHKLEAPWDDVMNTAFDAVCDCLEAGLTHDYPAGERV